jgi:hypothetical protein
MALKESVASGMLHHQLGTQIRYYGVPRTRMKPCNKSIIVFALTLAGSNCGLFAQNTSPIPIVKDVEWQPLAAQVKRVLDAMELAGSPVSSETKVAFEKLRLEPNIASASEKVQELLDPLCLVWVDINPESRVKVARAGAAAELAEHGWRQFLVKVSNQAGVTARLQAQSPNARRIAGSTANQVADRWLDLLMFDQQPMQQTLSGLKLEYRILELYSRDAGQRESTLSFNVGQGTQDLGFRNELPILFDCKPARPVTLRVQDENGQPTTASFLIRDKLGRVYPSTNKRLAPDFAFQPQIYRADGEILALPDGSYNVEFSRGPESLPQRTTLEIHGQPQTAAFQVKRWIDPSALGWWSGDHHIHAAGCAHYEKPTEGVAPPDMMRHCLGEDLKVGCNLTWGPCFDFQKQFFCGHVDAVSRYPYLLRYDVEVSGFGSHESGHLCLLRLSEQIYPGGSSKDHWPTLCLNTLRWAKKQGAVCGPAHSGWGLKVDSDQLPNYQVPPFDGIGADEYVADVTHEVEGPDGKMVPAVDFLSLVDTPSVWELNIWYHTLNAGFRTRVSGETDFPCIYGERVGLGRSYVKLGDKLDFDAWCEGIRQGRNYASDGRSHLLEYRINGALVGENGSEVKLEAPASVQITAKVAALLDEKPEPNIHGLRTDEKPYWHLERARIGRTREVPLEVIVNGQPAFRTNFVADGALRDIVLPLRIERSSWVTLRILPSSHTNPIWVMVGGKPFAPSRRSVDWCLKGVNQCWSQKKRFIRPAEMKDAEKAYEHAREVYRQRLELAEKD